MKNLPVANSNAYGKKKAWLAKALLASALLVPGLLIPGIVPPAAAQVSIGINIGPPPPPRVLRARPRMPGPEFMWVDGYWYVVRGRWVWHPGYWTRLPFPGARWIGPRYEGGRFFDGYWDGDRGRFDHDHRWDRGRARDFDRDRGRGRR